MSDPFDMGGLGDLIGGVTRGLQELKEQAATLETEGQAGGGLVTVRVNGRQEVLAVRIAEEAMEDRELLEDLVLAATNEAMRRVQEEMAARMSALTGGLPLPPGLF